MPILNQMRPRWTLIVVLFAGATIAVYAVCHGQGGAVDTLVGMARRFSYGALFAVGWWSSSLLLQKWMTQPAPSPIIQKLQLPVPAFQTPEPSGVSRYRVSGMDQDTKFEVTEVIYADSPSNAQLKVELKGVNVAAVERA